jgi:hypothetical protein
VVGEVVVGEVVEDAWSSTEVVGEVVVGEVVEDAWSSTSRRLSAHDSGHSRNALSSLSESWCTSCSIPPQKTPRKEWPQYRLKVEPEPVVAG